MMREIKVDFYDRFKCVASDCPITCCKEWKISVDDVTCEKWKRTKWNACDKEKMTAYLADYLTKKDGSTVIALNKTKECPFLNQQKLCKLVLDYGDNILSKTCMEFPRQVHEFENRREFSMASCCPVVVDILHESKEVSFRHNIDGTEENSLFQMRSLLIDCMKNKNYTPEKALLMGFYLLLESEEDVAFTAEDLKELSEVVEHIEYSAEDTFAECNEIFLDMTENYRKQGIYRDFLEELTQLAEHIENGLAMDVEKETEQFEEVFMVYEDLFRNYLVSEFYGQLLLPDYEWEDMVVAMQWIGIEYAMMRHTVFLSWKIHKKLDYEQVRETIVYIARMTGYDDEDIREYLEECFESLIWEWGYFAFITGNRRRKT